MWIGKKLRWERSSTALEAEATVLKSKKPFSRSFNGDGNGNFSSRNEGRAGPCVFQMPMNYPRYSKADYESMAKWKLDNLLQEYGLPVRGDVAFKRSYAMGAFLWPDQLWTKDLTVNILSIHLRFGCLLLSIGLYIMSIHPRLDFIILGEVLYKFL